MSSASGPENEPEQTSEKTPERSKKLKAVSVIVLLAAAGFLFLASGRVWLQATAAAPAGSKTAIDVTGSQATAVLPALAATAAAAALALSLSKTVARIILGAVEVLAAAAWIATAFSLVADPAAAASGTVRATTGLAQAADVKMTAWPFIGTAVAVVMLVVGMIVITAGRRWSAGGTRFERAGTHDTPDPGLDSSSAWDALTRGDDPS